MSQAPRSPSAHPSTGQGFRGGTSGEASVNAGGAGSIPGSGRAPAGGNGNPLQYSCLENPETGEPAGL